MPCRAFLFSLAPEHVSPLHGGHSVAMPCRAFLFSLLTPLKPYTLNMTRLVAMPCRAFLFSLDRDGVMKWTTLQMLSQCPVGHFCFLSIRYIASIRPRHRLISRNALSGIFVFSPWHGWLRGRVLLSSAVAMPCRAFLFSLNRCAAPGDRPMALRRNALSGIFVFSRILAASAAGCARSQCPVGHFCFLSRWRPPVAKRTLGVAMPCRAFLFSLLFLLSRSC